MFGSMAVQVYLYVFILYNVFCIDSVNVALTCGSSTQSRKGQSTKMEKKSRDNPYVHIHTSVVQSMLSQ